MKTTTTFSLTAQVDSMLPDFSAFRAPWSWTGSAFLCRLMAWSMVCQTSLLHVFFGPAMPRCSKMRVRTLKIEGPNSHFERLGDTLPVFFNSGIQLDVSAMASDCCLPSLCWSCAGLSVGRRFPDIKVATHFFGIIQHYQPLSIIILTIINHH